MQSALSIVQSVRKRINSPVPTSLFGSSDPDELQLLELLYSVCEELRQAKCWTVQKKLHEFDTEADRSQYPLPPDYYAPLTGTFYNQDTNEPFSGPSSDAAFALFVEGDSPALREFTWRPFGPNESLAANTAQGQFEVNPVPSSAVNCRFEYLSRNLFQPPFWTISTAYSSGDVVSSNGRIYTCDTNGTSSSDPADAPSGTDDNQADGTTQWDHRAAAYETILADTDLCIFDADLVKLGLRAKLYEEQGGAYQEAMAEFKAKIDAAQARFKGSYVGRMFGRGRGRRPIYHIPDRSWSI